MLKPLFILAIAMSAEPQSTGLMRLLARADPRISISPPRVDRDLTLNGASAEAIRNQVEVSLRRCGFTIVEYNAVSDESSASVVLSGKSHKNYYYGYASVEIVMTMKVDGEHVFVDAFSDGFIFSGPPGGAATEIRTVIAQALDKFCSSYLRARDEVRNEKEKQP